MAWYSSFVVLIGALFHPSSRDFCFPRMSSAINIVQIITAVLLIVFVLLQQRGSGLGGAFGGGGEVYQTKRGVEKGLFVATIVVGILFVISGFLRVFIS